MPHASHIFTQGYKLLGSELQTQWLVKYVTIMAWCETNSVNCFHDNKARKIEKHDEKEREEPECKTSFTIMTKGDEA